MKKRSINIGWAIAADASLDVPAYRRRFGYYLKQRGISWEIADIKKKYDLVVVHHASDITAWKNYSKSKIILDYNDNYLIETGNTFKNIGRGLAKYLFRHWSQLEIDYRKAYTRIMQRADAIVCCTDEQEVDARKYCSNVHQIADMQCDPDWTTKTNYDLGSMLNLVWEGLPNFDGLVTLTPVLRAFQAKRNFALHLLTALKYGKYLRNLMQVHTKNEISRILSLNQCFLYEWNPYLFSKIVALCDLAIIPIDMRNPFMVSKPGNKLLFFWRIGMPTLVDPTPAYSKLMSECGLNMVCRSSDEWTEKLERFSLDRDARHAAGIQALQFVKENYSEQKLLAKWDQVLDSVL